MEPFLLFFSSVDIISLLLEAETSKIHSSFQVLFFQIKQYFSRKLLVSNRTKKIMKSN